MEPKTPEGKAGRYIRLWRDFGPNTDRIDLEKLFRELILKTSGDDHCTIAYQGLKSVDGAMMYDSAAEHWRISVRKDIASRGRKRFTLAHEIGHFVQHRSVTSAFRCSYSDLSDYYTSRFEVEANQFASFLLMPSDSFRDFAKSNEFAHASLIALADRFGVSREAAAYRVLKLQKRKKWAFIKSRDGFVISSMVSEPAYHDRFYFRKETEIPATLTDGAALLGGSCDEIGGVCRINRRSAAFSGQIAKSAVDDYVYHYIELSN